MQAFLKKKVIEVFAQVEEEKEWTGDGKWVISHQADEAKGQANKIFIDLSGSFLKNRKDEIMRQAKNMFLNEKYLWLETVIITADKELLYVFERI